MKVMLNCSIETVGFMNRLYLQGVESIDFKFPLQLRFRESPLIESHLGLISLMPVIVFVPQVQLTSVAAQKSSILKGYRYEKVAARFEYSSCFPQWRAQAFLEMFKCSPGEIGIKAACPKFSSSDVARNEIVIRKPLGEFFNRLAAQVQSYDPKTFRSIVECPLAKTAATVKDPAVGRQV